MKIRESLVTQIWSRQLIEKDALMTAEGEKVQVFYPGRINVDRGPDFFDAIIAIDGGKILRGEVELHVNSSEWRSHGHYRDPVYNGVILHVVMWNRDDKTSQLHNGKRVPILALYPYLKSSLKELSCTAQLSLPEYEPCHRTWLRYGKGVIGEILDRAGEQRFYSKVEQFRKRLNEERAGQVFYEGVMRALGYTKNKEPFQELARKLPLNILVELIRKGDIHSLQALMLGAAGLLPSQRHRKNGEYHFSIRDEWEVIGLEQLWKAFDIEEKLCESDWHFFRIRPENLPTRRIVGISHLLWCYGEEGVLGDISNLISQSPPRRVQKDLERVFMVTVDGYWANHYDFGLRARQDVSLIGQGRARQIVVNVLLPFFFAMADEVSQTYFKGRAIDLYRRYPRLGENWITRYMERQIFREDQTNMLNSACREQGLIHLYKEYCINRICSECPLARGSTTGHSEKAGTGYFFNAKAVEEAAQGV